MANRIAAVLACVSLVGCQEYNFNPVGKCTIQPGQKRIALEGFTTADILFVVDDSGSMDPMQQNLATNFGSFIDRLAQAQADRVAIGLQPLQFHIAVTTSSIFVAPANSQCQSGGSGLVCNTSQGTAELATACTAAGQGCTGLVTHYNVSGGCTAGIASNGAQYPAGNFVAAAGNPTVTDFVFTGAQWATWGTGSPDAGLSAAVNQFQQNIQVGSCGSGEEQHLQAGRLAVQKALAGQQPGAAGKWPHAGAKMIVVWVGNEDDCSNPKDPASALVLSGAVGNDSCAQDAHHLPAPTKLFLVEDIANYFFSLGRPLGAAFIRPGPLDPAQPTFCTAGPGFGDGKRFRDMAAAFSAQGSSVVEGSICDANFGATLQQIADLVKPLPSLKLGTLPAAGVVTQLRIVDAGEKTVHVCAGPSTSGEWWFAADCADPSVGNATGNGGADPSTCIAIDRSGSCVASPGQTYVAEYLGQVPGPSETNPLGGCDTAAGGTDCATLLGGAAADWTCQPVPGQTRGTCLCGGP